MNILEEMVSFFRRRLWPPSPSPPPRPPPRPKPTPLVASTLSPQGGTVGIEMEILLSATGGTKPYAWTTTTLPQGLELEDDVIVGSPSTIQSLQVTATVRDDSVPSQFSPTVFTINIVGQVTSPPVLVSANGGIEEVTLTWTSPTNDGGSPVISYTITRGVIPNGESVVESGVTSLTYVDSPLTNGVEYYYKVEAVNGVGTSPPSDELFATPSAGNTIPQPPTLVSITPSSSSNTLLWEPNGTGGSPITSYTVLRGTSSNGESILVQGITGTTYLDLGLNNGTTYFYKIQAINVIGSSGFSNEETGTPLPIEITAAIREIMAVGTMNIESVSLTSTIHPSLTVTSSEKTPVTASIISTSSFASSNHQTRRVTSSILDSLGVVTIPASAKKLSSSLTPSLGVTGSATEGSPTLGLFTASLTQASAESLASTLGVTLQGLSGYTDGSSWGSIPSYFPATSGVQLLLGVNLTPDGIGLSAVSSNLSTFESLAGELPDNAIIRLGWEFDTADFSWGNGVNGNTPSQYAAAWQIVVPAMKGVNSTLLFDFCCNTGTSTLSELETFYPGDSYVDFIGGDHYDNYGGGGDFSQFGPTVNLAHNHSKPLSCGEWGLNNDDNPTFINDAAQVFLSPSSASSHYGWPSYSVGYHSYFSSGSNSVITNYPNSVAAYKADFS